MTNTDKYKLLHRGIVYDLVGMASMAVPVIGPFLDLLWAPIAARLMKKMYKGTEGRIASVIVFLEEILPFTDVIPSFTLMWLYTYVWKKQPKGQRIPIRYDE
ncbi:hypothetical protein EI546_04050 [Aequorivita sp. H23M31]|uniref:Uncharacterized protein n=1 Tax=Aequorivita ciconiae TaxID=2494375 RepID=A0A410G141_9FLAO|nr:hypothetical protein [Aequorivita sp. H23M31]QAA80950.1 hypothetical protein EI546_04050 [Aequorivita sp. H23M31]